MGNLSIRLKLFIPLLVACALVLGLLITSSVVLKSTQNTSEILGKTYLPAVSTVLNADRDLYQARLAQLEYLYAESNSERQAARESFSENNKQAFDRMKATQALLLEQSLKLPEITEYDRRYNDWTRESEMFFSSPTFPSYKHLNTSFEALRVIYDKVGESADFSGAQLRERSKASSDSIFLILTVIALLTVLFLAITTYVAPKIISGRIERLRSKVADLGSGSGDLRRRIDVDSSDELGELAIAFNGLIDSVAQMVSGVRASAGNFGVEVEHFFQSIQDVSRTTHEQSETLSSLASGYHQTAAATEQVSGIAQRTAGLTKSALSATEKGVGVIQHNAQDIKRLSGEFAQTYSVADDLKQNSQQIASVVETIRSIAEQTNLLALNAAIEAARAGEQGRGFAVVADEVRTLASRTQESTDEIDQIVSTFQDQVVNVFDAIKRGCDKLSVTESETETAQRSFDEIASLVGEINHLSLQTATATDEQTAAAEEINRSVAYIDDRAQKNAESMAIASKAATSFKAEAEGLVNSISRFQVD